MYGTGMGPEACASVDSPKPFPSCFTMNICGFYVHPISLRQPSTALYCSLLNALASLSMPLFQHLMCTVMGS